MLTCPTPLYPSRRRHYALSNFRNHSPNDTAPHLDTLRHPHKQCQKTSNFKPHKPQEDLGSYYKVPNGQAIHIG